MAPPAPRDTDYGMVGSRRSSAGLASTEDTNHAWRKSSADLNSGRLTYPRIHDDGEWNSSRWPGMLIP
jgi:hypothetical protein